MKFGIKMVELTTEKNINPFLLAIVALFTICLLLVNFQSSPQKGELWKTTYYLESTEPLPVHFYKRVISNENNQIIYYDLLLKRKDTVSVKSFLKNSRIISNN